MAAPSFGAAGTIAANSSATSISVPYPSGITSGMLLVVDLLEKPQAGTWNEGSGWTRIHNGAGVSVQVKVADGTETGSFTFTHTASAAYVAGIMYRFSGNDTSSPVEQTKPWSGYTTTLTIRELLGNTSGADRLCANFMAVWDDTNGNDNATLYTERSDVTSTVGTDCAFHMYDYVQAAAGNPGADSYTIPTIEVAYGVTTAIKPPGYGNDVNGVLAANIGKINGVATANIAKVNGA